MSVADAPRPPALAIGGVGGSGTRLIADIARDVGFYLGGDLNVAIDNLWFTLLFKRLELWASDASGEFSRSVQAFQAAMCGNQPLNAEQSAWVLSLADADRPQHVAPWLRQRAETLLAAASLQPAGTAPWGWKEPNTHVFLDRLPAVYPTLKYIHVMRHGLDMAFNTNQNQVRLWGPALIGVRSDEEQVDPRVSLRFWSAVHRRAVALGRAMGEQFLLLNYDAFCASPLEGLRGLLTFLGVAIDPSTERTMMDRVHMPKSVGRYKQHGLDAFDPADVEYVRSLGFEV